ncbi:DUF2946 domain-containing protein [Massilia glaciei]|nr:DUF2946 domain-containing protein [Massilia glaciei]
MQRRASAWIACLAFLLAALVPAMTQLLAANNAAGDWIEICSAKGIKLVKATLADAAPASGDGAPHGENCPFCQTHADTPAMPPGARTVLPTIAAAQRFPSLFYQSPRAQFVWAGARPRAPPALS